MNEFIKRHVEESIQNNRIDSSLYKTYNVKSGLRNENGTGVLVGLSQVSNVVGYHLEDGKKMNMSGMLYYRGYNITDIVSSIKKEKRHGFEEVMYLLIFGALPKQEALTEFKLILGKYRDLPKSFVENMILKNPSINVMNKLMRSILVLYSYDKNPEDQTIENVLNESIRLISRFPTIVAYGYQAKKHYYDNESLIIHMPKADLSTAEYLLYLIRPDKLYTEKEAEVLDICLLLHADHGANNSSFATHVVSSTGTDLYSTICTAVGSLKGPKHGGANLNVKSMIDDIKKNVEYTDKVKLKDYLSKILDKEVFDRAGLIYGMGHAVYTLSDPRAEILRGYAYELALEKNKVHEYELYVSIEQLTKELFIERKGIDICSNVDLYSGFVYSMLNIPEELYTPIFAISRVAGWVAHRIEQVMSDNKIIRPAYQFVLEYKDFVDLHNR
ncbi:MAG: citrate synthase [Candidatus Izemoplasmatales bacterium]